jgi:hypothetical protein
MDVCLAKPARYPGEELTPSIATLRDQLFHVTRFERTAINQIDAPRSMRTRPPSNKDTRACLANPSYERMAPLLRKR